MASTAKHVHVNEGSVVTQSAGTSVGAMTAVDQATRLSPRATLRLTTLW